MKNSKVLLGIGLFLLALAGFWMMITKSGIALADDYSYSNFTYTGIDNTAETVYGIGFWEKSKMILTGGNSISIFHFSQIPVVVKSENVVNMVKTGIISNILGGNNMRIGNSHNITLIGGEGISDQEELPGGNDNATFFGGKGNTIEGGMTDTPTVLLGGENNIVETDHDANAIVGGSVNKIKQGAENVNILGGTSISISGDNVIAAGQRINGNVSDSFVFNDGQNAIDVNGSGMFFLKVANGVGFGSTSIAGNSGVVSNGAVKVGTLDIGSTACELDATVNIGLIGLWHGCLVGCTSGSAASGGRWEMLGHSDACRQICGQSDKCIPEKEPNSSSSVDYPSFCMGYVSTGRSHMCSSTGLDAYNNVIFETYLIDSDSLCPTTGYNQCAYQCNDGYHLTGDSTGQKSGAKMCYQDCVLPWDHSQFRKHNEKITGYFSSGMNCATESLWSSSCETGQFMCVDGKWYVMNGDFADKEYTGYIYQTCSLDDYICDFSEYDLILDDITELDDPDWVETGSWYGGYELLGVRGIYQVCVDYKSDSENNQSCEPDQYHYKFNRCNSGYSQVSDDGICRKQCTYRENIIDHGEEITLYTCDTTTCPDECIDHEKEFQCNDGTLYEVIDGYISEIRLNTGVYNQTGCSVSGVVCDSSYYSIDSGKYASIQERGLFMSCTGYSVYNNSCVLGDVVYHLESCNANYYKTGDTCEPCPTGYSSPAGSTGLNACVITCESGEYVASTGGQCVSCGVGKYSIADTVNATAMSYCSNCNKPDNSDYTSVGTNGPDSCEWECYPGYVQEGNSCVVKSAQCGTATVSWYVTEPTESLCDYGTPSSVMAGDSKFSWTCTNLTSIEECNATRKYSCGTRPTLYGASYGSYVRDYNYNPASWEYSTNLPLGICEWHCDEGYQLVDNECVVDMSNV